MGNPVHKKCTESFRWWFQSDAEKAMKGYCDKYYPLVCEVDRAKVNLEEATDTKKVSLNTLYESQN